MARTDLTQLFETFFSTNRGPDGSVPEYGLRALSESPGIDDIQLTLTFKSGCVYCCGEPDCHFSPDWPRLRSLAAASGFSLGAPITIRLHGVVEAGSMFTSTIEVGGPERNDPYEFDETYSEDEEANNRPQDIC